MASATDHRQGRLRGSARYFCPADAAARAAMDAVWAGLAGGEARPIDAARPGPRGGGAAPSTTAAARATFYDLCGRPLGPADYLALAAAVRVLLIDDIPRLGSSNFNQARRFVTLVDALYEARVTLFASRRRRARPPLRRGRGRLRVRPHRLAGSRRCRRADWPGRQRPGWRRRGAPWHRPASCRERHRCRTPRSPNAARPPSRAASA